MLTTISVHLDDSDDSKATVKVSTKRDMHGKPYALVQVVGDDGYSSVDLYLGARMLQALKNAGEFGGSQLAHLIQEDLDAAREAREMSDAEPTGHLTAEEV